jgi:hypothetical protein
MTERGRQKSAAFGASKLWTGGVTRRSGGAVTAAKMTRLRLLSMVFVTRAAVAPVFRLPKRREAVVGQPTVDAVNEIVPMLKRIGRIGRLIQRRGSRNGGSADSPAIALRDAGVGGACRVKGLAVFAAASHRWGADPRVAIAESGVIVARNAIALTRVGMSEVRQFAIFKAAARRLGGPLSGAPRQSREAESSAARMVRRVAVGAGTTVAPMGAYAIQGARASVAPVETAPIVAAMPSRMNAAPAEAGLERDDRTDFGRLIDEHLAEAAMRPPSGVSGFDERLTPVFAGMVGPY